MSVQLVCVCMHLDYRDQLQNDPSLFIILCVSSMFFICRIADINPESRVHSLVINFVTLFYK